MRSRRLDVSAIMWGFVFVCVAGLGVWIGLGYPVNWTAVQIAAPTALIIVGIVGLMVSRTRA